MWRARRRWRRRTAAAPRSRARAAPASAAGWRRGRRRSWSRRLRPSGSGGRCGFGPPQRDRCLVRRRRDRGLAETESPRRHQRAVDGCGVGAGQPGIERGNRRLHERPGSARARSALRCRRRVGDRRGVAGASSRRAGGRRRRAPRAIGRVRADRGRRGRGAATFGAPVPRSSAPLCRGQFGDARLAGTGDADEVGGRERKVGERHVCSVASSATRVSRRPVTGPRQPASHASSAGSLTAHGEVADAAQLPVGAASTGNTTATRWVTVTPVRGVRMKSRSGGGASPRSMSPSVLTAAVRLPRTK